MLIVGIFAGLASQMNQYAFAVLLKKRYPTADVRLVNGCEWLKYLGHNGYELDTLFGIRPDDIDAGTIKKLANFYPGCGVIAKAHNAVYQIRDKIIGPRKSQIMINDLLPDDEVLTRLDLSKDWLFWGNCSMWVFSEIESELRNAFAFKTPLSGTNKSLANDIAHSNSVSIHLRRGDYRKFGFKLLDSTYYAKAIAEIDRRVGSPHYFVFSDDQAEARQMFGNLSTVTFVHGNSKTNSYIDMQLMSLCQHNIIANSGFSAVAAWLNTNPDKIVIGNGTGISSNMPGYIKIDTP